MSSLLGLLFFTRNDDVNSVHAGQAGVDGVAV